MQPEKWNRADSRERPRLGGREGLGRMGMGRLGCFSQIWSPPIPPHPVKVSASLLEPSRIFTCIRQQRPFLQAKAVLHLTLCGKWQGSWISPAP